MFDSKKSNWQNHGYVIHSIKYRKQTCKQRQLKVYL